MKFTIWNYLILLGWLDTVPVPGIKISNLVFKRSNNVSLTVHDRHSSLLDSGCIAAKTTAFRRQTPEWVWLISKIRQLEKHWDITFREAESETVLTRRFNSLGIVLVLPSPPGVFPRLRRGKRCGRRRTRNRAILVYRNQMGENKQKWQLLERVFSILDHAACARLWPTINPLFSCLVALAC